jgi:hypothetical protein
MVSVTFSGGPSAAAGHFLVSAARPTRSPGDEAGDAAVVERDGDGAHAPERRARKAASFGRRASPE